MIIYGISFQHCDRDGYDDSRTSWDHLYQLKSDAKKVVSSNNQQILAHRLQEWIKSCELIKVNQARNDALVTAGLETPFKYNTPPMPNLKSCEHSEGWATVEEVEVQ